MSNALDWIGALASPFTNFFSQIGANATNREINRQNNAANLQIAKDTNATNMMMNKENIAFQQAENEIARQREDNAVQRRVADMVRSGLSKTLAAGSPAAANAMNAPNNQFAAQIGHPMEAFKTTAPRFDFDYAQTRSNLASAESAPIHAKAALEDAKTKRMAQKFEIFKFAKQHGLSLKEFELDLDKFAHSKEMDNKYYDLKNYIDRETLSLDQKKYQLSVDELALKRDELNNKIMDSVSERHYRSWLQMYDSAKLNLDRNADKRAATLAEYQITEIEARVQSYLSEVQLDQAQIRFIKKNTQKVVAECLKMYDEHVKMNAEVKEIMQRTITGIYNLAVASQDGGKTTDMTVTESNAHEKALDREVQSKIAGTTSMRTFFSIILWALIGTGGKINVPGI